MKKLYLIILAVSLAGPAANADDYYFCTVGTDNKLYFMRIPGPGEHYGFDVVHTVDIAGYSDGLTYDGEHWWIEYNGSLYCFDQNGDYVRDFPKPEPGDSIRGLGWDGQYLWIFHNPVIYQRDIYGNPGPYGQFTVETGGSTSVVIVDDKILLGDWEVGSMTLAFIYVYDFNGNVLFTGYQESANDPGFYSLAYHDGLVWTSFWGYGSEYYFYHTRGLVYDDVGGWEVYATIHDGFTQNLSICDADFINIVESSLGKIKAYFADK
jgi:hypothetical protein